MIIKAGVEHASILSELGKRTFAETFVGLMYYTQEIVDGYTVKAFAPDLIRQELIDPKICYFLLQVDGAPAGYAKLVEKPGAACVAHLHAIYLERLYLAKDFHRQGLGTGLLTAIHQEARARTYDWLWLSVWEYNRPAVAFYRKHGFQHLGEWDWPFESGGQRYVDRDWIMAIPVSSPLSPASV